MRISRRRLLRGDLSGRGAPVRPPWVVREFVERCARSDACRDACPTGIPTRGRGAFSEVDFSRGECTFCGDCIAKPAPAAAPVMARARSG